MGELTKLTNQELLDLLHLLEGHISYLEAENNKIEEHTNDRKDNQAN